MSISVSILEKKTYLAVQNDTYRTFQFIIWKNVHTRVSISYKSGRGYAYIEKAVSLAS